MLVGLMESIAIIEKEIEYAKTVNHQMALGMSQVKQLIEDRIRRELIEEAIETEFFRHIIGDDSNSIEIKIRGFVDDKDIIK